MRDLFILVVCQLSTPPRSLCSPLRTTTSWLGAGPLIAFTAMLGAIHHRSSPVQVDDYKRSYSGSAAELLHWFEDIRIKAASLAERINEIEVPTQVVWGELEVMFGVSNAQYLNDALPHSKLQILPEAGHLAGSDQPEIFATMITEWVNSDH